MHAEDERLKKDLAGAGIDLDGSRPGELSVYPLDQVEVIGVVWIESDQRFAPVLANKRRLLEIMAETRRETCDLRWPTHKEVMEECKDTSKL